jgi:hypothetical protein
MNCLQVHELNCAFLLNSIKLCHLGKKLAMQTLCDCYSELKEKKLNFMCLDCDPTKRVGGNAWLARIESRPLHKLSWIICGLPQSFPSQIPGSSIKPRPLPLTSFPIHYWLSSYTWTLSDILKASLNNTNELLVLLYCGVRFRIVCPIFTNISEEFSAPRVKRPETEADHPPPTSA